MKPYKIVKLNNEPFDFLIIATSYENPLSYIEDITKEVNLQHFRILFDLTLINGMKSNRYISCNYRQGENYLHACTIIKNIDNHLKQMSNDFFIENIDIVQNSSVSNSLKFLLQSGMV